MHGANKPYPPIQVERTDPAYAKEMLSNMGGADSEMSAVSLYFYNHLVTREYSELSQAFQKIGVAEMRHLEIFGTLALQLGADPRLWSAVGHRKKYWTPRYNSYSVKPRKLLTTALIGEHMAIEKYTRQVKEIGDPNIVENLGRIIEDERAHIKILTELLKQYG